MGLVKSKLIKNLANQYPNFYSKDSIQPYLPIAAKGPWILTNENKLIYDVGGYGMLGLGHNPPEVNKVLGKDQVMANIMTPNISQYNFWNRIKKELDPSYKSISCLNSGSEANTLAMRLANIHNNKNPVTVSMIGSFHGRTEKPALASQSCRNAYQNNLYDYKNKNIERKTEFGNY